MKGKFLKELEVITKISQRIQKQEELRDALQEMLIMAKDAYNIGNGIVLINEDGKLKTLAIVGYPEGVFDLTFDIKSGQGIIGFSAKKRKTIVVSDVAKNPHYILGIPDTKSEVAVPIIIKRKIIGVLNFESPEKNAFKKTDVKNAQALAAVIGFMILNFKTQKKLEKVVKRLEMLTKATTRLNNTVRLSNTLSAIVKVIKDYFGYKYFDIMLKDDKGDLVPIKTSKDFPINVIKNFKANINRGEGLTGTAAKLGEIVCVNDVAKDKRYIPAIKDIRSEIVIPIKVQGELIGVLDIEDPELDRFKRDDIKILSVLAIEIGIAIQNASLYEKTKELATTDELTGLANYRSFRDYLDREVKRAERYQKSFSLVMFDIDYFKQYNDQNGHDQGNVVLKRIGKILLYNNRSVDLPARFGGEEFVTILPETSKRGALVYAERIRKVVEKTKFKGESRQPNGRLTVSGGVAEFPKDGNTSAKIIKAVDTACYEAKDSGRNQIRGFNELH